MTSHSEFTQTNVFASEVLLFGDFCRFLEVVSKENGDAKKKKCAKFIQNYRNRYGNDFYSVMRLLLPHLDKERTNYGMKEVVLAKTYISVMGLARDSIYAQRLIHWKMPGSSKNKTAGDFASVAFEVIAPRSTVVGRGKMTIEDVNYQLDVLNAASGQQEFQKVIRHLFNNYTAIEQKWIIRIILKELKIGLSEKSVFLLFHPDACNLFNVCSDLRKVCEDLQDPHTRLPSSDIILFYPFKPMLAKPVAVQNVIKTMGGSFWIEEKLDGERVQLHMKDGRFEYYSRRATQYTYLYGSNKSEGSLTPHIADLFHPRVKEIILDGEMIEYDPLMDVYKPFGTLKTAGKDHSDNPNKERPCYIIFDVVLINGKSIIDQPLQKRKDWLRTLITENPGYLKIINHKECSTVKDLIDALDEAVMKRQEGIIIKKPSSKYVLNERIDDWIKIKPEYLDALGDSLDLLIIGADFGSGKRGNMFGSFMCGLRDSTSSDDSPRFISFCRFGTGQTMKEAEDIKNKLEGWQKFEPNNLPNWLEVGKDKPHMIIPPWNSIVVQVKASEIVAGNQFAANYTLRFPRFEKLRDDKDWTSAMTYEEMMNLRRQASGRLQSKKVTEDDLITIARAVKRKGKTTTPRRVKKYTMLETFTSNIGQVEEKSMIFKDMKFHIMLTKYKENTKADFERMIKEHGGSYSQHPGNDSEIRLIAEDASNFRVKNLINQGVRDIIHPRWILECINAFKLIPLSPKYMVFITESTKHEFLTRMDEWGDSYADEITTEELQETFDLMPLDEKNLISNPQKRRKLADEIEERYFADTGLPNCLFRRCVVYIDYPPPREHVQDMNKLWALYEGCRDRLKLIELTLRYHDAQIVNDFSIRNVTHVIFDEKDLSRYSEIKEFHEKRNMSPYYVRSSWVIDSENCGVLLEENGN
ncbi:16107_t:CDS:10 [Funneliformis geosporum]|nr:16107_t:CDS:10 [Funneliformis geosporum]